MGATPSLSLTGDISTLAGEAWRLQFVIGKPGEPGEELTGRLFNLIVSRGSDRSSLATLNGANAFDPTENRGAGLWSTSFDISSALTSAAFADPDRLTLTYALVETIGDVDEPDYTFWLTGRFSAASAPALPVATQLSDGVPVLRALRPSRSERIYLSTLGGRGVPGLSSQWGAREW